MFSSWAKAHPKVREVRRRAAEEAPHHHQQRTRWTWSRRPVWLSNEARICTENNSGGIGLWRFFIIQPSLELVPKIHGLACHCSTRKRFGCSINLPVHGGLEARIKRSPPRLGHNLNEQWYLSSAPSEGFVYDPRLAAQRVQRQVAIAESPSPRERERDRSFSGATKRGQIHMASPRHHRPMACISLSSSAVVLTTVRSSTR
jgi:hypothetical protein